MPIDTILHRPTTLTECGADVYATITALEAERRAIEADLAWLDAHPEARTIDDEMRHGAAVDAVRDRVIRWTRKVRRHGRAAEILLAVAHARIAELEAAGLGTMHDEVPRG